PWRRLIDNLIVPLQLKGVPRHAARQEAHRWLPFFGLDGFADAYPSQLSGGMRQRAALLRTFLTEREIIALDEPFGALDAHTRRRMQVWLADVHRQMRRTVLLITHDVDEALVLADRVVVLGPRPARVVYEADIDLPRPRDILSPAFAAYKGAVLAHLGNGEEDPSAPAVAGSPRGARAGGRRGRCLLGRLLPRRPFPGRSLAGPSIRGGCLPGHALPGRSRWRAGPHPSRGRPAPGRGSCPPAPGSVG